MEEVEEDRMAAFDFPHGDVGGRAEVVGVVGDGMGLLDFLPQAEVVVVVEVVEEVVVVVIVVFFEEVEVDEVVDFLPLLLRLPPRLGNSSFLGGVEREVAEALRPLLPRLGKSSFLRVE